VENGIEKGTVHVQPAVVVNEAQVPERTQKETDAGHVVPIISTSLSWPIIRNE
jgi:hypothetical protein